MMRSYLGLSLAFCLMFVVGCPDGDDGGTGGTGGGTGGAGGAGATGGAGGAGGTGGVPSGGLQTKNITLGCANSVTPTVSSLPAELEVDSGPISGGQEFAATLGGTQFFPEAFLDVAQGIVPGGLRTARLLDSRLIVQVRSGAIEVDGAGGTGGAGGAAGAGGAGGSGIPGVPLGPDVASLVPGPTRLCNFPEDQVCTQDSDCVGLVCNPPITLVDLPISEDCAPGGVCDALGKLEGAGSQCTLNSFCVTGDLQLTLESATQTYMADASGEVLFGWADQGLTNNMLDSGTGLYTFPPPSISNPVEQGLQVVAGAITVGIECVMAVTDMVGTGVTPDSDLITYAIP